MCIQGCSCVWISNGRLGFGTRMCIGQIDPLGGTVSAQCVLTRAEIQYQGLRTECRTDSGSTVGMSLIQKMRCRGKQGVVVTHKMAGLVHITETARTTTTTTTTTTTRGPHLSLLVERGDWRANWFEFLV